MSVPLPAAPRLGPQGRPCSSCGAPLAADQRYCLSCGARDGAPRLDPVALARGAGARAARTGRRASVRVARRRASLAFPAPSPSVIAAAALALFGFGVFAGTLGGPGAADTLAAAARPIIVVRGPAPPAPAPAPAPAPSPAPPADRGSSAPPAVADTGAGTSTPAAPTPAPATPADTTPTTTTPSDTTGTGGGGGGGSGTGTPVASRLKHVWVIELTGHGFDAAFGPTSPAPYLSKDLAGQGVVLSGYHAVAHGSLPNGLALLTGRGPSPETLQDCPQYVAYSGGHGCVLPARTDNLPTQLTAAGRTWKAYVEDVERDAGQPTDGTLSCRHPQLGQPDPWTAPRPGDAYLTARDPFVYLRDLTDTPDCASTVVGLGPLTQDIADPQSAPNFAYIAPNACHDGRDAPCADGAPAGLAAADAWLKTVVGPILQSKAYADGGIVVITFDQAPADGPEADSSGTPWLPAQWPAVTDPAAPKPGGGKVGALVLSPYVGKPGTVVKTPYDHFSLLRTIDEAFALDPIGVAKDERVRPFGDDVITPARSG